MKRYIKIVLVVLLLSISAKAELKKHINILVLFSYNESLPWTRDFVKGLYQAKHKYDMPIEYYIEYMDKNRLLKHMDDDEWYKYLKEKYQQTQIDGVIAESKSAAEFMYNHADKLFVNTPHIYYSTKKHDKEYPYVKEVLAQIDKSAAQTVNLAIRQSQQAKRAYIVYGDFHKSNSLKEAYEKALKRRNMEIIYIKTDDLDMLKYRVSKIDKKDILLYSLKKIKYKDRLLLPKDVLKHLSEVSSVPIYSTFGPLLGSGTVGGSVIDAKILASELLDSIIEYNRSGKFLLDYDFTHTYIDYNVLKKHNMTKRYMPKDATIIDKPQLIWVSHTNEVIIVAISMIILLILLLMLVKSNIKLKNTNYLLQEETKKKLHHQNIAMQKSKMADIGQMIATISHQLKQPLGTISAISSSAIIAKQLDGEVDIIANSSKVLEQTSFMTETIDLFRNFFNPNKNKESIKLTYVVEKSLAISKDYLSGVDIIENISPLESRVSVYPNELIQVVINLLKNAKEIQDEKSLTDKVIEVCIFEERDKQIITIHDNGGGVPESVKEKIFDEYFSTKGEEKGTGIGLNLSRQILQEQHNGRLYVKNEPLLVNNKEYFGAKFYMELVIESE
jgi:signal transduction histidine kinase/vacuolar-type H+-ATPase subunit F/Vma7